MKSWKAPYVLCTVEAQLTHLTKYFPAILATNVLPSKMPRKVH